MRKKKIVKEIVRYMKLKDKNEENLVIERIAKKHHKDVLSYYLSMIEENKESCLHYIRILLV